MLLDSNIIIYSAQPKHSELRDHIVSNNPSVSVITVIEVLGFHRLSEADKHLFSTLFALTDILPLTDDIVEKAISIRQQRKMSLGDAIIAATALVSNQQLATHNLTDFIWIPNLSVFDPLS